MTSFLVTLGDISLKKDVSFHLSISSGARGSSFSITPTALLSLGIEEIQVQFPLTNFPYRLWMGHTVFMFQSPACVMEIFAITYSASI